MTSYRAACSLPSSGLILAVLCLVGPRVSAMTCEELFVPQTTILTTLSERPQTKPIQFWNLKAKAQLKALDSAIANVATPPHADAFEPAIERAANLFQQLNDQANDRIDTFVSAVFSHAREFPDTTFAREPVHSLVGSTLQKRYVVESIYKKLKSEKRRKTSYALAASIFYYGRFAQASVLQDTIQSLRKSQTTTELERQNLLLLATHLLRPGVEDDVRALGESSNLAPNEPTLLSHYWYHFFEQGDPALMPKLSKEDSKALIAAVRNSVLGVELSQEARKSYLIVMAFSYGTDLPLPLKRELTELARPVLFGEPRLFEDSVTADLWFAYRLVHTHRR